MNDKQDSGNLSEAISKMLITISSKLSSLSDNSELKKELYSIEKKFLLLEQDIAMATLDYSKREEDFKEDLNSPNYNEDLSITNHGKNLVWSTDRLLIKCVQIVEGTSEAVSNILNAMTKEKIKDSVAKDLNIVSRDAVLDDTMKQQIEKDLAKPFEFLEKNEKKIEPEVIKVGNYEVDI
jgi:hypothetical protein